MLRLLLRLFLVGLLLATLGVLGAAGYVFHTITTACKGECVSRSDLRESHPAESSLVFDRSGRQYGTFFLENRRSVTLDEIPEHVRQAFLAVEDQRFYQHRGIDYTRVVGAALANLKSGRVAQGSSTLSMQLVRNLYPDIVPPAEKSLRRKIVEAHIARKMEATLSKDALLEYYLNTIYFGAGTYGVEAASRIYFKKGVAELSVAEGALLAALPKAPSRLDPYINAEGARARRDLVLALMSDAGWLSEERRAEARAESVALGYESADAARASETGHLDYVLEQARREVEHRFGAALYTGGLRVYLTIDPAQQDAAERSLEDGIRRVERGQYGHYTHPVRREDPDAGSAAEPGATSAGTPRSTPYLQGAIVLIDNRDGAIRALVGGRSFEESSFNRATQGKRQPGSAFKPFVFAAALEKGYGPFHRVLDAPIRIQTDDGSWWEPRNYGGGGSGDYITLEHALKVSNNRATVRLAQAVGMSRVVETARRMGIDTRLPLYPSVSLGSAEVTPLEMAAAYTPIARIDGNRVRPFLVARVESRSGEVLYAHTPVVARALDARTSFGLRRMLRTVVDHGTGYPVRQAGYAGPAFGKTGTTTSAADLWFVGGTPEYTASVWLGFDVPREVLRGANATGGRIVAPIWADLLKRVRPSSAAKDWERPLSVASLGEWGGAQQFALGEDGDEYYDSETADPAADAAEVEPQTIIRITESAPARGAEAVATRGGAAQDTTRLCVRPRTEQNSGEVSFLVPCHRLNAPGR
jgi:penicillin-binding protein 1A